MKVSPRFTGSDWKALDFSKHEVWPRATEIFLDRIVGRFTAPADVLLASERPTPPAQRRFGFAVLALDCLLIETLGSFVAGVITSTGKSRWVFKNCLLSRAPFKESFTAETAELLYVHFRCGILHQAETAGESRVLSVGPLVRAQHDHLVINRTKLHAATKRALDLYAADVKAGRDQQLRDNFRTKMDHICRHG